MKHILLISLLISMLFVALSSPIAYRWTASMLERFKINVEDPVRPQSMYYVLPHAVVVFVFTLIVLYLKYLPKLMARDKPAVPILPPDFQPPQMPPYPNVPEYHHPLDPPDNNSAPFETQR